MDLRLLRAEKAKKPDDTRVTFYLAQTYDLLGDLESALATYQERIDMGGWLQEVFEAHLRRVSPGLHPCNLVQAWLRDLILGSLELAWPDSTKAISWPCGASGPADASGH